MLDALRHRNFALLWAGQLISIVGDWLLIIALPISIYERTGSALATSLATIAGTVPRAVFGSFAGALIDRWNYKHAMILADILRACVLPLLLFAGSDGMIWLVYVVAALLATCSVVFGPARTALIPRLVEKEYLLAANALDSLSDTIAGLLGPALGGLLLGLIYLTGVVLLDAASFLISGLLIAYVAIPARPVDRVVEPKNNQAHSMISSVIAGFWQTWLLGLGQVRHNPTIFMLFVVYGVAMLGQGMINVLWVVFVKKILAGDAVVYGGIQTAVAIGTLIGGALIGSFGRKASLRYLVGLNGVGIGIILIGVCNLPSLPITFMLNVFLGIPAIGFFVGTRTLLQQSVADDLRGRVFGTLGSVAALCSLIGMVLAGVLGEQFPVAGILSAAAALYILAGCICLIIPHLD